MSNPFPMTEAQIAARKAERYARFEPDRQLEARFLKDVEKHQMFVHRDDGVYRHVTFQVPGSSVYRFDLITFPGSLVYTGDMGTFVFRRLEDMFEFFRTQEPSYLKEVGLTLYTNHGYWSEKLVATDCSGRHGGKSTEFDEDRCAAVLKECLDAWIREARESGYLTKDERRELYEEVSRLIEDIPNYGESILHKVGEFTWRPSRGYGEEKGKTYYFDDLYEHSFEKYTHSFMWCCMALAWGIAKYDAWKDEQAKTPPVEKEPFAYIPKWVPARIEKFNHVTGHITKNVGAKAENYMPIYLKDDTK